MLAITVIAAHAWPLGGFGASPTLGGLPLGSWAVAGFFALSGYLIAGSRARSKATSFYWKRALRLMPGFWVCLLVVAFVFAPLSVVISDDSLWTPQAAIRYVVGNSLLSIEVRGIEGTLRGTPYEVAWNGSLWTLFYEAGAYGVAGLLFSVGIVRRHSSLAFTALLVAAVGTSAARATIDSFGVPGHILAFGVWLAPFFVAGMLTWALRGLVRASWGHVVASAATLVLLVSLGGEWVVLLAPIPLAVLLLNLGVLLPVRIGVTNDISYGVYIYAFPVQQLMAVAGMQEHMGPFRLAAVAILLTTVPAWLSWKLIEQPCLQYKHLVGGSRPRPPVLAP